MKRTLAIALLLAFYSPIFAQQKDPIASEKPFTFKFYGRIRADLFYNSRANNETVDGLFYMYPKDHDYDAVGNDLNGGAQGNFYMLYTRLGVDIAGPKLGAANTSAKVEIDFRGSGTMFAVPRIRHAYVNLAWTRSQLLVGQAWHPLFGEVSPSMINLSTGAPFQPFNRSPQIRFRYMTPCKFQFTAASIWQQQYASAGSDGKTHNYLKNSCVPELYAITGKQYGVGLDVDQLVSANIQLSYNLPHWKLGVEFEPSTAWYGTTNMSNGRVIETHSVTNYRVLGVMMYIF